MRKIFVLDTSVILHEGNCLEEFEDNDVVVPVAVLEELDRHKKGQLTIHYNARDFIRAIDSLSEDRVFNGGVEIGPGKGKFQIKLEFDRAKEVLKNFPENSPDHRILNTAFYLSEEYQDKKVVLVSKDVNLRMKAKSLGLIAQDLTFSQVEDVDNLYRGVRLIESVPAELIDFFYKDPFELELSALEGVEGLEDLKPNEFFIMRNGSKSGLARFNSDNQNFQRVKKKACVNIESRNAEQTFTLNALVDPDISLVTLSGKAGTGKTLMALAAALEQKKDFHQITIARPTVPLSNRDSGYLPGDINEKLDPYMQPLYDNLDYIQSKYGKEGWIKDLQESKKIIVTPLAYIRGRSLSRMFFIIDEAQNLTPHEVKTIISRAGEGTKVVLTGDIYQIDHPYLDSRSNGLSHVIAKFTGQKTYAHVGLEKGERSELAELAAGLL